MPQVYYGPYDEKNQDYANSGNANLGRFPLGHTLRLPDDREYRFTLNDGTVEVAGNLYQSVAALAGHTNRPVDVVRAIDVALMSATLVTTLAGIDIYAEGMAHTNDVTGEAYAYRIRRAFTAGAAHAASVASGVLTVNFAAGEMLQVALDTTSEVTFTRNRYHQATIHLSPPTASLTGVSPGVAALDRFYWSQVKGYSAVLANLTLLAGLPVQASIDINGAVESYKRRSQSGGTTIAVPTAAALRAVALLDQDGTTTDFWVLASVSTQITGIYDISAGIAQNSPIVGMCVKANASTEFALVDLNIV